MNLPRRAFLKQIGCGAAGLGLAGSLPLSLHAEGLINGKLPRSLPEAQGVSSSGILAYLDAIANSEHEYHSFMMARRGKVIAEGWWAPYRPGARHMMYSLSKSFTSTAVGLAVTEGRLTVNDLVASFFPDDLPPKVSDNLAALRVKHLLTMSVGRPKDMVGTMQKDQNWVKAFLAEPFPQPPGSVFLYNSDATYMLSAIVQKLTGQKVFDYLQPRLFQPLEIRNIWWETCPRGINLGASGLNLHTEDIAKFAQLYLQKGQWEGAQAIPAPWVEEATTFKIQQPADNGGDLEQLKKTSEWHQGYCYQFWRCRHNAFRGDGAFGQYAIVMPDQDAIIAITSETANMGGQMALVWEHLLPAIDGPPSSGEISRDLAHRLDSLALPLPEGRFESPVADAVSGKTFRVDANDAGAQTVAFRFEGRRAKFVLTDAEGEYPVACGLGWWADGVTSMPGEPPKITIGDLRPAKITSAGAWTDDHTFVMTWRFYETPHHDTVTCRFDGDTVRLSFLSSVAQKQPTTHPEKRPPLVGRLG